MITNFFKKKFFKKEDLKKNSFEDLKKNSFNDNDIINVMALLLEVSSIDGNIEKLEKSKIFEVISSYFSLNEQTLNKYYEEAVLLQEDSSSFHNFTSKIHKKYNYSQKIDILEMLWEIVLVNKDIDDYESSFMRRISGLLHMKDVDSGLIKNKVKKKLKF